MRTLKLSGGTHLADADVRNLLACAGSLLTTLHLHGCRSLSDVTCASLARSCPDLRDLALSGCTRIGDESLVVIGHALPLQSLALAGLVEVTSASAMAAVSGLCCAGAGAQVQGNVPATLTSLDLARCTRIAMLETQQARAFFSLKILDLSSCSAAISDDALRRAAAACAGVSGSYGGVRLESLALWGTTAADNTLALLLEQVGARLLHLDVKGSERAGDQTAVAVAATCRLLTHLHISETRVTDGGLSAILQSCSALEVFVAADCRCTHFRSHDVLSILQCRWRNLLKLDLSNNLTVGDELLDTLVESSTMSYAPPDLLRHEPRLEVLNIGGCIGVTTKPLVRLLCIAQRTLRIVGVRNCAQVDTHAVVCAMPVSVDIDELELQAFE